MRSGALRRSVRTLLVLSGLHSDLAVSDRGRVVYGALPAC